MIARAQREDDRAVAFAIREGQLAGEFHRGFIGFRAARTEVSAFKPLTRHLGQPIGQRDVLVRPGLPDRDKRQPRDLALDRFDHPLVAMPKIARDWAGRHVDEWIAVLVVKCDPLGADGARHQPAWFAGGEAILRPARRWPGLGVRLVDVVAGFHFSHYPIMTAVTCRANAGSAINALQRLNLVSAYLAKSSAGLLLASWIRPHSVHKRSHIAL